MMTKKFVFLAAVMLTIFSKASCAAEQPLTILIHSIKASVKDGVEIAIEVTNVSNTAVRFGVTAGGVGDTLSKTFTAEVRHDDGSPAPMTHAGEVAYKGIRSTNQDADERYKYAIQSVKLDLLHPGQTVSYTMRVSSLFDMSQPGLYVVQLTRRSPVFSENIKSNALQIDVR